MFTVISFSHRAVNFWLAYGYFVVQKDGWLSLRGDYLGFLIVSGKQKGIHLAVNPFDCFGCGERIRTSDLRVMSPTSYQTAPPRGNRRRR